MAQTTQSALSAAITFKVQRKVLDNLRARMVFADPAYADSGDFDAGHDTLTFIGVPDIALNVTALTEGTKPTSQALSITTVTVSTTQYGQTVSITDLAKVKSPVALVDIGAERLARQASESIDQVTRDVIALGGTVLYHTGVAGLVRSDVAAGDLVTSTELKRLRAKMFKNKIPPFGDGYYRLFVSPGVGYDLRTDTTTGGWMDAWKYTDAMPLLKSELGRMDGFRIIEVVNAPTFSSTVTVHASIAVGDIKGWGAGDLQTLRTYHVTPGGDHSDPIGQEELLGWKVNFGVAVLSNSYYYRYESAATAI